MNSRTLRRRFALALTLVGIACGGSGDGTSAPPSPVLTTLSVSLSSATIQTGQTASATASGRDQSGASIATGSLTWASTATSVATVDGSGNITAVGAGTTTISATSGHVTGSAVLTVLSSGGGTPLTIGTAGQSTAFLTAPDPNISLTLQPNSQYLIAVVNTDDDAETGESFTLAGTAGGAVASKTPVGALAASPAPVGPSRFDMAARPPRYPEEKRLAANHIAMLESNRRVFASFGSARSAWVKAKAARSSAPRAAAAAAAGPPPFSTTVGTVNQVYVKSRIGGSCTQMDSIGARTVAVGQHVIVLADTNRITWPDSLRPDSAFYKTFADEYDQITWPHMNTYIGDPLAFDASLSKLNKVTVVITPTLNNYAKISGSAVVAFVSACDFFPFATTGPDADLSNQTEMFYSWVPGSSGYTVDLWKKALRATAAHETKHIVAFADRILNNSETLDEVWLEEGLAQISSEIWGRNFNLAAWKGQATFLQTAACEINLGPNAPCDATNTKPLNLLTGHLPFFFEYLQEESDSHDEGLGLDTPSNYGAGWTFARWAIDQYATNEATFIKSLINEPRLTGLANLSLHTGQSAQTLLVYWNLATAIFQVPSYTPADPRITIPSFNFADIFNVGQSQLTCGGQRCGLFTDSGDPVFPIQPAVLAVSTFNNTIVDMPGTSAAFYQLSATSAGTELLHLRASDGTPLPTTSALRVAILRVR